MKRRLFNAAACLSLLAGFALTAAWLRSGWRFDQLVFHKENMFASFRSHDGYLELWWENDPAADFSSSFYFWSEPHSGWSWNHFGYETDFVDASGFVLSVPHWWPIIAAGVLPVWWLYSRRGRPEKACPACGYELRGSESATCPECGAEREAKP